MVKRLLLVAAFGVETLGIGAIGLGIGIEVSYQADFGFVCITSGSLLVATGGIMWGKFWPLLRKRGQ